MVQGVPFCVNCVPVYLSPELIWGTFFIWGKRGLLELIWGIAILIWEKVGCGIRHVMRELLGIGL